MTNTDTTSSPSSSTDRRAETSPVNGAKSRGPKTESGKRKSSANAVKHGLYSRSVVLASESLEEYADLTNFFIEHYQPANIEEHELVTDMINARWRMRRAERHEKSLMNVDMSLALEEAEQKSKSINMDHLEALVLHRDSFTRGLENATRIGQRAERTYHRSRAALLKMRNQDAAARPEPHPFPAEPIVRNEPTPPPPPPPPQSPSANWLRRLFLAILIVLASLTQAPPAEGKAPALPPSSWVNVRKAAPMPAVNHSNYDRFGLAPGLHFL